MTNQTHTDYLTEVTHCLYDDPQLSQAIKKIADTSTRHKADRTQRRKMLFELVTQAFKETPADLPLSPYQLTRLLRTAVQHQHHNLVRWLLRRDINPNIVQDTPSALHIAIENSDIRMVVMLKRYGATLNKFDIQQTGYHRFHAGFEYQ